ncbi:23S rRNA (adenine(2503)-C(2))-methyltransferase RlmN [Dolichospermum sp. ST_sed1]|jgi:23S rRNA (adenine2503-C2)-methyltransferase|nr:23S rRNA (adenine(2503)-C(2))-methyltransferase RlmN [Dolichospermum sp. ST_sed1]MDD1423722.1 23S rRNA (adenine(2503)-C(2))-methyltransferase RlmN [Dolichospermum sp. ST_sed9]MDD1431044.1 23S rRNA (adenine(2503)-C(2))-methyltransferase RlmN [Dolichospermum sp. ST_sed6]MDD1439202.1 23S rRNA (adenine(2503)-C(2))-methyltransferase RlmN [Dolichospermum sp. ST_sed3]MDD1445467.1 23S rRNA (adenine(2503)-C(2))-methyltransferase RlmN [Dolichospermum sp. ST_sed8]MDD1453936.1 23S rRNA (adenine(2503)-C
MSATPLVSQVDSPNSSKSELLPPLLGASVTELTAWVQQQGQPGYRGKQLHDSIYNKGVRSLADISVFPKNWRSEVADIPIGRSSLHYRSVAPDDTVKYLLKLDDGEIVETVGIPSDKRLTVCVSTQVGCPMACDFCATGKGGYKRNLSRAEIVDQVLTVQEDFQERVSNVVFMGMGEPLLNTENVILAIKSINQDIGIGARSLTLSTVGIRDRILEVAEHQLQITLAVSLHAPNQALREQLIPSAKPYPIEDLLAECREYVEITGRRVTFEYILLAGVNDLPEHALELSKRLRGFQSHVNLIPYNPIEEVDYKRPTRDRIEAFVNVLQQQNTAVSVRYSRGLEADAACGQLRTTKR